MTWCDRRPCAAAAKGLKTETDVPPDASADTDREMLGLVLQNLIGNAVKYSTAGTVTVRAMGHGWKPRPANRAAGNCPSPHQGPGIAPQTPPRLFDAFARGETHGQPGVGLGSATPPTRPACWAASSRSNRKWARARPSASLPNLRSDESAGGWAPPPLVPSPLYPGERVRVRGGFEICRFEISNLRSQSPSPLPSPLSTGERGQISLALRIVIRTCLSHRFCLSLPRVFRNLGCLRPVAEDPAPAAKPAAAAHAAVPLFKNKGVPKGWTASAAWDDVSKPGPEGAMGRGRAGVLNGSEPRGTWLVSDREYGDFVLEFDWKLGERGNSGCGIRFPVKGDPAFDGLEDPDGRRALQQGPGRAGQAHRQHLQGDRAEEAGLQADRVEPLRHHGQGADIKVELNGEVVQDVNLDDHTRRSNANDGNKCPPLKDRPRRGHIGFQELSRGGAHVMIKNAKMTETK